MTHPVRSDSATTHTLTTLLRMPELPEVEA
jgi:hypothetical protein